MLYQILMWYIRGVILLWNSSSSFTLRQHAAAPSARIQGTVFWLGANLDPQQPDTDQYLIGLSFSLLFSVLRHISWFFSQQSRLHWLILLPGIKTIALIHIHQRNLIVARISLAQSWPITKKQCHGGLTCQNRSGLRTEVMRDSGNIGSDWVYINSTPPFKCLQTRQLLFIYYTKVLEFGVLAGSWKCFT